MTESEFKKRFLQKCTKEPEKYYPTTTLRAKGFIRRQCTNCSRHYWTTNPDRKMCGDTKCVGGFSFIGEKSKKNLSYTQVWEEFSRVHENLGYTPVKRYPVVARWNPTTDFVMASIAAFQPYVVSGEVAPPANPLTIPQFSIRFPDLDNVGITGAHFTGFVMMGEHAFVQPQKYDVNKYCLDHLEWLQKGMGLKTEYLTIHEDAWEGGGNFGPSIEFFTGGLEISNQVYMQYEQTDKGPRELKIKVLDMGQGQERASWFSQGLPNSFETTFPTTIKKLRTATGVNYDKELLTKFSPQAGLLNSGDFEDMNEQWRQVAEKTGIPIEVLKPEIQKNAGVYSIAEHTRTLLVALADGALPSNVGGMYNLRVILRRALATIKQHGWNIDILDVAEWNAKELKKQYPELLEKIENVQKILEVEKRKFEESTTRVKATVQRMAGKQLRAEEMLELYESQGISPELLKSASEEQGKSFTVPEKFYSMLSERHEHHEQETQTQQDRIKLGDIPETEAMYYADWKKKDFDAKIIFLQDKFAVLDKTIFYPTSGGQIHDTGVLGGIKIVDVFKQGKIIVHELEKEPTFKKGEIVHGIINWERRFQLAQHHTATHIINAAASTVLGEHVNQASAKKDVDKAHLDITHYENLTPEEVQKIEDEANNIIKKRIQVHKEFMPRENAEKKYGMEIYQGGAVPGKTIRIVSIEDTDIEACGGTHLDNTEEIGKIKILKTTKVKDGVVRITFVAGKAAEKVEKEDEELKNDLAKELNCTKEQIPGRAKELFENWKSMKKGKSFNAKLSSTEKSKGNILQETTEVLQTQQEHLLKTIQRFKNEAEI
ncbi:alanine--tRNA ligase [Candidatus Woesearchaeota archaeon]|nr:alanine--tRNA ligase [Candidatus Woesearchaeota archaeon]